MRARNIVISLVTLAGLLGLLGASGFLSLMSGMGVRGMPNPASQAAGYACMVWWLAGVGGALLAAYRMAGGRLASGARLALAPLAVALTLPFFSVASLSLLTPEPQPAEYAPETEAPVEAVAGQDESPPGPTSLARFLPFGSGPDMGQVAYLSALEAARNKGVSLDHLETTQYIAEDARLRREMETLWLMLGFADGGQDVTSACAAFPMQFLPLLDSPGGNPVGRGVVRAACSDYGPQLALDLWVDRDEHLTLAMTSYSEIDGEFDPLVITGRFEGDRWVRFNLPNRPPVWMEIGAVAGLKSRVMDVDDIAGQAAIVFQEPPFESEMAAEHLVILAEPNELSAALLAVDPANIRIGILSSGMLSGEYMRVEVISYEGDEIEELDECSLAKLKGSEVPGVRQQTGWVRYRDGGRAIVGFIENPCGC